MGGAAVVLCTALACVNSLTQVERQETKLSATDNQLLSQNKDLNNMQIQAAASLQFQGLPVVDNMDDKIIVKRATVKKAKDAKKKVRHHVKKAKNSKKRKKLFDKRRKSVESESESKQTKSLSKSEESEKSETAPDSDSSAQKSKSGKTKSSKSSSSFSYEDTSSSVGSEDYSSDTEDSDYSSDDSDTEDSDDDKTKPTEEVSLSSVEKSVSSIEPLHSGLDSSPPASSDSEFESSASKTPNSEDSSEISYTMSSSAEDAFPTDDTIEEGSGSGSGEEEDKSKSTPSKKKSEETPKVETEVKKKKGKKITKNNIKLNNKNNLLNGLKSGEKKDLKLEKNGKNKMGKSSKILSTSQHLQATTDKVLNMAHMGNKVDVEEKTNTNTRPQLEMLKVKPAADPHKKMVLENDLNADYPLNETVEIRNWQGTLAPIIGEPYVAPLHQQPDSFWDAIYRSTDTDLPTPMGAGSAEATTLIPELYAHQLSNVHAEVPGLRNPKNIEMKNKDKGKKEKKKPKLSIKEKKKKKREKQENKNPNNLVASGTKIKAAGAHGEVQHPVMMGDDHKNHHETAHILAAGKSGDNLKTPSEEERESGTTYKPEGAYEYPSFRHPDFNPDTAYDENGIPIHESPGWTEPPTLPGDRRFGKERARPGAAAGMAAHTHVHEQVVRPQATHSQSMVVKVGDHAHTAAGQMIQQPGELNSHMAAQQHQQVAEALVGSHLHLHPENHNGGQPQLLIDPLSQTHVGVETVGAPLYLPAHHPGATIRESEVNHNIHKREAAKSGESLEAISSVMSTRELHHHAAQYNQRQAQHNNQAYKMSVEEFKNKEDSAPLEALNPALFAYRNMMKVKEKTEKNLEIPKSAEVVAVFVNSKDGKSVRVPLAAGANIDLRQLEKDLPKLIRAKQRLEMPEVNADTKQSEAMNPLLYKRRNMFKVPDITRDNLNVNQDLVRQVALAQAQRRTQETMALEDYIKNGGHQGLPHNLRGRGRENFNPLFINPKKFFHVETNKFKTSSGESIQEVKREIKESDNPALYSYRDLFSAQPRQVLPLSNHQAIKVPGCGRVDSTKPGMFADQIPVIDKSEDSSLDPQVHQYVGRGIEARNPYLVNYPQMFKVNKENVQTAQQQNKGQQPASLDPNVQQFMGKGREALNPYLINYTSMFKAVEENAPLNQNIQNEQTYVKNMRTDQNIALHYQDNVFQHRLPIIDKSEEKSLDPQLQHYMGKNKEALNPYLVNFPNMFARVEHRPPANNLVNHLRSELNRQLLQKYKTRQEQYVTRGDARPQLFANYEARSWPRAPAGPFEPMKTLRVSGRDGDIRQKREMKTLRVSGRDGDIRQKREVSSSNEDDKNKAERRRAKLSEEISPPDRSSQQVSPVTRRTKDHDKDDDDSFASYFEGADPNVVEEDESTPPPEITTSHRQKVLQTNARILQRLTREMRPQWRRQLEALNLNPDNTTVEFTDSMQVEIKEAIEQRLLKKPPTKDTIDKLTRDLVKVIEEREKNNRSVGHIMIGESPRKNPLIRGTLNVGPDKERAAYHLQYWPAEQPQSGPRELNGTINLREVKVNLTDKHVASKILRSILTVRPRGLSHQQANKVLNKIFTTPASLMTQRQRVYIHTRHKVDEIPTIGTKKPESGQELETLYDRLISNAMGNIKNVKIENRDTIRIRVPDPYHVKDSPATEKTTQAAEYVTTTTATTARNVVKTSSTYIKPGVGRILATPVTVSSMSTVTHNIVGRILTTPVTKSSMSTVKHYIGDRMTDEISKLQETISKSRNISFMLMKEMEASEMKKNSTVTEDMEKKQALGATMKGGWKLQQRIRDFRPVRPFPTMPPFVRRWPTFRKTDVDVPLTPYTLSTKLTMRPKYGGPRHEPFFFNDFKRIRTVYPTRITTVIPTTTLLTETVAGDSSINVPTTSVQTSTVASQTTSVPEIRITTSETLMFKVSTSTVDSETTSVSQKRQSTSDSSIVNVRTRSVHPETTSVPRRTTPSLSERPHTSSFPSTAESSTLLRYFMDDDSRPALDAQMETTTPDYIEINVGGRIVSVKPPFTLPTKAPRPTVVTTRAPSTTRHSHIHRIKHHVKRGFKKFFNLFGIRKSSSEEEKS